MCVVENKIKWNHSSGGGWKQNCNQALALACKFCMCLWLLLFWLLLCESEPNDPVETDQNAQHFPCRIGLLILLPCCFFFLFVWCYIRTKILFLPSKFPFRRIGFCFPKSNTPKKVRFVLIFLLLLLRRSSLFLKVPLSVCRCVFDSSPNTILRVGFPV